MSRHWFENLTLDFVSWVPTIGIVPFIMMKNFNLTNFPEKINTFLSIMVAFVCIIIVFLYAIQTSQIIASIRKSKKKTKNKLANKIYQESVHVFLSLIFVIILTIATAISSKIMFMIFSYLLIIVRIRYTIAFRNIYSKLQFLMVIFLQIICVIYTSIFLCFGVI